MSESSQNKQSSWLSGIASDSPAAPSKTGRAWRLVLLGAPGIGKGTQAELLTEKLGATQLSTGELFRAAKKQPVEQLSPAMSEAVRVMSSGGLVSDETVIALVRERSHCLHNSSGFLLDGYPRTVTQAEALEKLLQDEGLKLDGVLSYELPVEKVVERLAGRRVCSSCKKSYHIKDLPPKKEGVCDACGGSLFQRTDDQPEAVRIRLAAYEKSTAPLIEFYAARGQLLKIDCGHTPKETFEESLKALGLK